MWNGVLSYTTSDNTLSAPTLWLSGSGPSGPTYNASYQFTGDFNGDGKTDYMYNYGGWYVALSNGSGFNAPTQWLSNSGPSGPTYNIGYQYVGDFNGDGKTDYMYNYGGWYVALSNGSGFNAPTQWLSNSGPSGQTYSIGYQYMGDFNGDGKTDYLYSYGDWYVAESHEQADLLSSVSNGIGGITTIEYKPSTEYVNTLLPFPVQVVQSITTNDNNSITSVTQYSYADGYYDIAERDFRGFGYVKQVNPDQTTVESWFLQDNVYKGMMSQQTMKDAGGNIYTQTVNAYESTSPYGGCAFPFLRQTDGYLYDGTPNYKNVRTWFEYDGYGNRTRAYSYGDVSIPGDERDERIEYNYDTTNWIVSLPSRTYVTDNAANIKAQSWFTYDPANGNLLSKTDWLDGGVNPVTRFTYNSYGNQSTTTDPKNNVTTTSYDSTYTYPTTVTNQYFGFSSSKIYDPRYGKPLTETDINGNTTTYQYDVFGRPAKVINPYDNTSTEGTQSIYYENFGLGVGSQRVATHSTEQSGTGNYLWQENYFDGFGRTIMTRSEGPDGKVIVTETIYDTMGRVSSSSLPCFENPLPPQQWVSYSYDPMGRVIRVTNPDNTFVTRSYTLGTTASIDANFHKREEDRDAYGRLAKVREYTGTSPNFSLYATTTYQYDTLGNLVQVTDAAGNITSIGYNPLSRKTSMTDPDMGYWTYQYDANGNLTSQTDARNNTITFSYDALNRLTNKQYPTGPDVTYTYDELFSSNSKGRLTTVSDASGTTKFYYDKLGRVTSTVKNVDGVDYTTDSTYDALGRTTGITYPDPSRETVSYTYDTGGNLQNVVGYATYSNYNALGQAGGVTYGNGATTVYQYHPLNNRLFSITTNSLGQGRQNLSYSYDNMGNIQTITDLLDTTRTQSFQYDGLNRIAQAQSTAYGTLTYNFDAIGNITYNSQVGSYTYPPPGYARPHAVTQAGANSYSYDPNGNMTGKNGSVLTHDYENRLSTVVTGGSTTTFVYDFAGGRVKKTSASITTLYIDKLYECTSGVCTKHIFAGGNRIVSKKPSGTYYYHTDHLRSSSVVTDASGYKVEEIYYYPFGQTRLDSGSVNLHHKYTGQEEDAETGLYYYNARYYDPAIGRFVSADTMVPDPTNPQALNRYSYVLNNPLIFTDPTGHSWLSHIGHEIARAWHGVERSAIGHAVIQTAAAAVGFVACSGNPACAAIAAASVDYAYTEDFKSALKSGATTYVTAIAYVEAGDYIKEFKITGQATQAGIHAGAGGVAGGINSTITGGNVGLGIVAGGFSGGMGSYFSGFTPFGSELAGHAIIGGVAGGTVYSIYGRNFGEGFAQGAVNSAFLLMFNHWLHDGRGLIYHRHGSNAPNWGNDWETGGPVIRELPPGPGMDAWNMLLNAAAVKYYGVLVDIGLIVAPIPKPVGVAIDVIREVVSDPKDAE